MKRINWIDWAKFLAITLIVPIHIPQGHGAQPITYFEVFIVQAFFFYSGYLKKDTIDLKTNLHNYWHRLIIPYFIYNILFYPYWLAKFYLTNNGMPTITEAIKPILGIFFFQAETNISCGLNSVTYFLIILLILHLTLDICHQIKYGKWIMIGLCIAGCLLYTLSKFNYFTRELVFVGLFKSIPFYYLGFLCKQHHVFEKVDFKKDFFYFLTTLMISTASFNYHANESIFVLHMISFWPTVLFGILAFTFFCKLLDRIHSNIVVNYSNGTMAFIGLHWMIAGTIRYGFLKPVFHVPSDYVYSSAEAYLLALVVTLILYPIILFFLKKVPWMLGRKTDSATAA
jgi:hypothetical protein